MRLLVVLLTALARVLGLLAGLLVRILALLAAVLTALVALLILLAALVVLVLIGHERVLPWLVDEPNQPDSEPFLFPFGIRRGDAGW